MDTKKLRQKILDLAIRGKLVPQDPNDEPASVLLEKIRAEKDRLIKEGKIKGNKKDKTSSDRLHYKQIEKIPFEIPESWEWTTLGEIFNLQAGKNITASEIREQSLEYSFPCYGGNGLRGYTKKYNRDGSYSLIGRQGALCGNINFADGKFYATEHAVVVETFCKTSVKWSFYFLSQLNLNKYATATAQPGLSVNKINEVFIPLPPLKEQQRIATEIELWFKWINELEQSQQELQDVIKLAKSKILDLAIHGKLVPQDPNDEPASELLKRVNPNAKITCDNPHYPFEKSRGWTQCKLKDICTFLSRGKSPKYSDLKQYPVFAQKCNQQFGITLEKVLFLDPNTLSKWPINYRLQTGDILVNSTGTGTVGRIGFFKSEYLGNYPFIVPDSHVSVVRTHNNIISEYIYYFLCSTFVQMYIEDNLVGSTNQKELYISTLENMLISLPPFTEQKHIVRKIEVLFAVLDNIEASLKV